MPPPRSLAAAVPRHLISEIIDHLKAANDGPRPPGLSLLGPQVWTFQHRNVMIKAYAISEKVYLKLYEVGSAAVDPDE